MSFSQSARRRTRSTFLAVLPVVATLMRVLGRSREPRRRDVPRRSRRSALGIPHGEVPGGVTVFDDEYPAVANLDPALLDALRRAATDAAAAGVEFRVNSGWRSPEYQEQLLAEAVSKYGSEEEAARWVATPTASPHVSGAAVDLGPSEARTWLAEHGAGYGLCQIYRNEPWHYELRPEAVDHGCPPMYADPTHDPRMRRDASTSGPRHLDRGSTTVHPQRTCRRHIENRIRPGNTTLP
ncbi:MAG TPA: M15 family metallopeptidase [Streptosporangiales bacterium]